MKRLISICMVAGMILCMAACGGAATADPTSADAVTRVEESAMQSGTASNELDAAAAAQEAVGYPLFDFNSRTVTLNSGYEMPILGLGMFSLSDSEAENSTYWALKAGNICIPGSSNEQHIIEDYDVWDFELTDEEMAQMTALEKDARFADY